MRDGEEGSLSLPDGWPGGAGAYGVMVRALGVATALVAFFTYLPAISNGFVNWDDPTYVYKNLMIQGQGDGFFVWAFTAVVSGNWHPLTLLSHAVDFQLFGLNPKGHHLVSVMLHALNTFLVFVLTLRLFVIGRYGGRYGVSALLAASPEGRPGYAFDRGSVVAAVSASLLFAVHPLHVESVAWISERKDLLCALFYLLAAVWYLNFAAGGGKRRALCYALSLVFFGMALLAKPMAVSLPIVLLIMDIYPLRRSVEIMKALLGKVPFFLLAAGAGIATLWTQSAGGALGSFESYPLGARLINALHSYAFYLYKSVWPLGLAPYYPYPDGGWGGAEIASAAALLVAISIAALLLARRYRALPSLWLYYIVTLLPVIGIVQVGAQAAADRYMYLPSIGPLMLAGLVAAFFSERTTGRGTSYRLVVAFALLAVSLSFAVGTKLQGKVWRDSITLWSYEIDLYPESVPIAYTNRGIAYGSEGRIEEALGDFSKAVELLPTHAKGFYNRAKALSLLGRDEEAIIDLTRAIEFRPSYVDAYYNRGAAYANLGRYDNAADDFRKVVEFDPGNLEARASLKRVLSLSGGNGGG